VAQAERSPATWLRGHRYRSAGIGLGLVASVALVLTFDARQARPAATAPFVAERPPDSVPPTNGGVTPIAAAAPTKPSLVGQPYGTMVRGLLTFRGNPSRTYYGQGPVPRNPKVVWRFPDEPMCSMSIDGGEQRRWCGTGWTGQPAVAERGGVTWVVFGAYDQAIHFLDGATGRRMLPDLLTGDIIKGSVTIDPDGYPLVYSGSRDDNYRVIGIDRQAPAELWRLPADAVSPVLWNNDWDGSGLIIDDHLVIGGENSQWHVVKLNRSMGDNGLVSVRPELVFHAPGWDPELLQALGDTEVSIEGSVAIWGNRVYFANSGGLVQGWDITGLAEGRPPERVFRFWTGDDTDASVVIDEEGMLYVASEWERQNDRATGVGQIMKLDPHREDPLVWSISDRGAEDDDVAGVWATPGLHRDLLIVPTNSGRFLGIDRRTGLLRWAKDLPGPTWASPVIVDDVLIQGDCAGVLHGYDVSDTRRDPPELWSVAIGGCIESTPAVWGGRIYVGTRAGFLVALADS